MTTMTQTLTRADIKAGLLPIIGAAALGMFLLFVTGFAEASVLHDAAHDTRHSLAFPCH